MSFEHHSKAVGSAYGVQVVEHRTALSGEFKGRHWTWWCAVCDVRSPQVPRHRIHYRTIGGVFDGAARHAFTSEHIRRTG